MSTTSFAKFVLLIAAMACSAVAQDPAILPNTKLLTLTGDVSAQMVESIDRWLLLETERVATNRAQFWKCDFSSPAAYERSVATNRDRLRAIIGAGDQRVASKLQFIAEAPLVATNRSSTNVSVTQVRWPVFDGVWAEGLLLEPPTGTVRVSVIALPDADQTPEMIAGVAPGLRPESQFARRLAESWLPGFDSDIGQPKR
jgi:hypothetical protein